MTSLCPGVLFQTPGFNRSSTPVGYPKSPEQIKRLSARVTDKKWPSDSPVAKIYDIGNTPSCMIILNNKSNKTRLRGQSPACSNSPSPDPERHFKNTAYDSTKHIKCLDSSSPRYQPEHVVPLSGAWINTTQRPPVKFSNGSHVNEWHHYDCQVSSDARWSSLENNKPKQPRPKTVPPSFRRHQYLHHPDFTRGQQRYMWDIARVYSTAQLKVLNQDRYEQLITRERRRGFFTHHEYLKYMKYIQGPRKKQFGEVEQCTETPRSKSGSSSPRTKRPSTGGTLRSGKSNTSQDSGTDQRMEKEASKKQTSNGNKSSDHSDVDDKSKNSDKLQGQEMKENDRKSKQKKHDKSPKMSGSESSDSKDSDKSTFKKNGSCNKVGGSGGNTPTITDDSKEAGSAATDVKDGAASEKNTADSTHVSEENGTEVRHPEGDNEAGNEEVNSVPSVNDKQSDDSSKYVDEAKTVAKRRKGNGSDHEPQSESNQEQSSQAEKETVDGVTSVDGRPASAKSHDSDRSMKIQGENTKNTDEPGEQTKESAAQPDEDHKGAINETNHRPTSASSDSSDRKFGNRPKSATSNHKTPSSRPLSASSNASDDKVHPGNTKADSESARPASGRSNASDPKYRPKSAKSNASDLTHVTRQSPSPPPVRSRTPSMSSLTSSSDSDDDRKSHRPRASREKRAKKAGDTSGNTDREQKEKSVKKQGSIYSVSSDDEKPRNVNEIEY